MEFEGLTPSPCSRLRARLDAANARAAFLMSIVSPALRTRLAAPLIERIRGHLAGLCLLGRGIPAVSGLPVSSEEAERRERRALAAYAAVITDGSDVKQWAVRQCVAVGAASSDSPATAAVSSLLDCLDRLRASTPPAEKSLEDYEIACPSGCGAIMRRSECAARAGRPAPFALRQTRSARCWRGPRGAHACFP